LLSARERLARKHDHHRDGCQKRTDETPFHRRPRLRSHLGNRYSKEVGKKNESPTCSWTSLVRWLFGSYQVIGFRGLLGSLSGSVVEPLATWTFSILSKWMMSRPSKGAANRRAKK